MQKRIFILLLAISLFICGCMKKKEAANNQVEEKRIRVLLPQTPSSLPLYFALKDNTMFEIEFYLNHSLANAKFIRGDAELLLTGLTVANSFSKEGLDFHLLSSQVDNLTHLVANDSLVSIEEIKGRTLIFPFADSPMEIVFTKIAEKHDLIQGKDYLVQYYPFTTSLQLLQEGSDFLVWLPEPFVTIAESKFKKKVSLSLNQLFTENITQINACQVLLLARNLDLRSEGVVNYLSKIYVDSLTWQAEKFINRLPENFPNRDAYHLQTIKRSSYNFLAGKELESSLDSLFKILKKDNYLAERILELN